MDRPYRDTAVGHPKDVLDNPVHYFSLTQHTRAKEICDRFDPHIRYADATLAEQEHFSNIHPPIELYMFFGASPACHEESHSFIEHNIRSHALYQLAEEGKIELQSFDSTAALSPLKVAPSVEVLTPAIGLFTISFMPKNTVEKIDVVIRLDKYDTTVDWVIYTFNSMHYSFFDIMFREAIKKYNYYIGQVFDQRGHILDLPDVSFDDIYLDDDIRAVVQSNIIDYIDPASVAIKLKNGLPIKRGVIFAGIPGTGKTFLSRVLAKELNTSFMVVTELNDYHELSGIFEFIKRFDQIVLLFEDLDIYMKDRTLEDSPMLSTLLNKVDGLEVQSHIILICTTNDIETMDKALNNRPGRFDRIITFNIPSNELKIRMLQGFCKGKDIEGIDFQKVVHTIPPTYTGAHLKEVYITACNEAVDAGEIGEDSIVQLTTDRFIHAVKAIQSRKEPSRIGYSAEEDNENG